MCTHTTIEMLYWGSISVEAKHLQENLFEMTQEKAVELILKLANTQAFVINVLIYAEYDAEIEILSDR